MIDRNYDRITEAERELWRHHERMKKLNREIVQEEHGEGCACDVCLPPDCGNFDDIGD